MGFQKKIDAEMMLQPFGGQSENIKILQNIWVSKKFVQYPDPNTQVYLIYVPTSYPKVPI